MIFIESKYILPKNITYAAKEYFFTLLSIVKKEKNAIKKIILSIYKDNIYIRRERDLSIFYKFNLLF